MRAVIASALVGAFVLVGCAGDAEEAATGESAVIGDSSVEILRKLAKEGPQKGVSDEQTPCGIRGLATTDNPALQWSYSSADEDEMLETAHAKDLKVAVLSRKMTATTRYGSSFLFPCSWGGSDCNEKKVTVAYDADRRITSVRTEVNGKPNGSCTIVRD